GSICRGRMRRSMAASSTSGWPGDGRGGRAQREHRSHIVLSNVGAWKKPATPATAWRQFFNMRQFEPNCPEFMLISSDASASLSCALCATPVPLTSRKHVRRVRVWRTMSRERSRRARRQCRRSRPHEEGQDAENTPHLWLPWDDHKGYGPDGAADRWAGRSAHAGGPLRVYSELWQRVR